MGHGGVAGGAAGGADARRAGAAHARAARAGRCGRGGGRGERGVSAATDKARARPAAATAARSARCLWGLRPAVRMRVSPVWGGAPFLSSFARSAPRLYLGRSTIHRPPPFRFSFSLSFEVRFLRSLLSLSFPLSLFLLLSLLRRAGSRARREDPRVAQAELQPDGEHQAQQGVRQPADPPEGQNTRKHSVRRSKLCVGWRTESPPAGRSPRADGAPWVSICCLHRVSRGPQPPTIEHATCK